MDGMSIVDMTLCSIQPQYYSDCHGVIYVVDSCDADNLSVSSETFSKQWLLSDSNNGL